MVHEIEDEEGSIRVIFCGQGDVTQKDEVVKIIWSKLGYLKKKNKVKNRTQYSEFFFLDGKKKQNLFF